jgi:hypothetical protein
VKAPTEPDELYLSWQGKVTGPHSSSEIQALLKLGKIHSLYRIQVEGAWHLLRDHISSLQAASKAPPQPQAPTEREAELPMVPVVVPDEDFPILDQHGNGLATEAVISEEEPVPTGLATAAFALSLFFFIPFANGLFWLLSLIFGHIALSQPGCREGTQCHLLARTALWLSYAMLGYLALGYGWYATTHEFAGIVVFFQLHYQMTAAVLSALVGAGVFMLAVWLVAKEVLTFSNSFVATLLPAAAGSLGVWIIQNTADLGALAQNRSLLMIGLLQFVLFVGQSIFWSVHIMLRDGSPLGLSRSTVCSLLYSGVFFGISVAYALLLASLMR